MQLSSGAAAAAKHGPRRSLGGANCAQKKSPRNAEGRFIMMPAIRNNSMPVPVEGAPINRLSSVFDRLFEDFLTPSGSATSRLPLSMWEDENHLYIEMDAPGVT